MGQTICYEVYRCRDGNASIVYIYALSFVFSMNGVAK
jgi:hypothetical protein